MLWTEWVLSLTVLWLICVPSGSACSLLIGAASDLAPLQPQLEQALPGCRMTFSFASSGTLARQIEHGADFDLYLAASRTFVERLVRAGAADLSATKPYARGRLGFWSATGLKWSDLRSASAVRIAIANPVHAPYGLAAKQALERQGLWSALESKIVYGENVRQAWRFAETGNADAGIVSWSLVHDRGGEMLPESWHDPILQVAAIPKRSRNPETARRFLDWLTSEQGQKVLASGGLERIQRAK
jgi:molybdate transport system substrate-binding protein